ncbi:MAG: PDZ domain-containing protein [Planctomycetota bacterium]
MNARLLITAIWLITHASAAATPTDRQQAVGNAVDAVLPSVVRIETVGGLAPGGSGQLVAGPTTGTVVSEDGLIVSSLFSFSQEPTSLLVRFHDGRRVPARIVARDRSRMLALLQAETAKPTTPASAVEPAAIQPGRWAVAVGRTLQPERPGVSVGIVSAAARMHGRVLQTDANVSPANYGGPLVDLTGRVYGVLVPMSPMSSDEQAGVEFYDSGIGFAVPLAHVFSVLPEWQKGQDLRPGKLGIGLKEGSELVAEPVIGSVWPRSPAALAGIEPGDLITAIDGEPVSTQAQLRARLVPRYGGQSIAVAWERRSAEGDDAEGDKAQQDKQLFEQTITLAGEMPPYTPAVLGVVPNRGSKAKGVAVRGVLPGSPAAEAGLRTGDLLTRINETDTPTAEAAAEALSALGPGDSVNVSVKRGDEPIERTLTFGQPPEAMPLAADLPPRRNAATTGDADDWELSPIVLPLSANLAQAYAPKDKTEDPLGLVLWLAPKAEDIEPLVESWKPLAARDGAILCIAAPAADNRWSADEAEYLLLLLRTLRGRYTIDPARTVFAAQGQPASAAGLAAYRLRRMVSGVVLLDAPLPRSLEPAQASPSQQLSALMLQTERTTLSPLLASDAARLRQAGYPTTEVTLEQADAGDALPLISRWVDSLDRL